MFDAILQGILLISEALWLAVTLGRRRDFVSTTLLWGMGALLLLFAFALVATGDAFAMMRAAAWLLFLHAPLVMLAGAALSWRSARGQALLHLFGALILAGVGVDAFLIEPRALEVNRHVIRTRELQAPLRIVVLSDIQTDRPGAYERRAFERAMAERPDLILLPGDFVQIPMSDEARYREQVQAFRALLPLLQAPLGVYAVRGNIEPRPTWATDLFAGTGVQAADLTLTETVGPLKLSRLSFGDGFNPALDLPAEPGFHVAFAHGPDFSLSPRVGADLLVAGHTHGGQVQLPFFGPPLTLSEIPRAAASGGLTELEGGRHLVVSRGVGMERGWAPRLRFRCRPEVVVIDVVPEG